MNTNPIPETSEVDLIKVRTIKRKHVEQLMEPLSTIMSPESWQNIEFLAYITASYCVLARQKDNGHLRVIRADTYCYSMKSADRVQSDHNNGWQNARAFLDSLPQLLLD